MVVVIYEMVTELVYTVLVPFIAMGLEQGTYDAVKCQYMETLDWSNLLIISVMVVTPVVKVVIVEETSLVNVVVDGGGMPVDGDPSDPPPVPVPAGPVPVGPGGKIPLPGATSELPDGSMLPVLV